VSLSAALKPSLWQRHRRAKKPSMRERYCGVSIFDKSAPQKYGGDNGRVTALQERVELFF
jgi:hypothetical protein